MECTAPSIKRTSSSNPEASQKRCRRPAPGTSQHNRAQMVVATILKNHGRADAQGYIYIYIYGYIWIHMDTYEYIKWIHMGAQQPGPGPKLAAGPGPGPWARAWARRQFWALAWPWDLKKHARKQATKHPKKHAHFLAPPTNP